MIYYSIIPIELAYYNVDELALQEIQVQGVNMLVHKENEQEATIVRVLSADPAHYLDPRFQPGKKIRHTPFIQEH
ncbi:YlzJ-like family protein [Thermoactinomyces mirandus]|uniref:YlzJ-like family protein n=1 Tax=Thermoactinomyces mirandus TaxID=2756294 RepID=A0A7W1XVG7_9BACL|nr:YlzJ-like family protein [Thermoactinomyces mirandus]MBA4603745.1 YlzJ-like family protein [Thermoactinomyces mirandus]